MVSPLTHSHKTMANFNHAVFYKENGTGSVLEQTVVAESRDAAEQKFLSANPTARIERILTTVPSKS